MDAPLQESGHPAERHCWYLQYLAAASWPGRTRPRAQQGRRQVGWTTGQKLTPQCFCSHEQPENRCGRVHSFRTRRREDFAALCAKNRHTRTIGRRHQ
eukprot:1196067-Prorocentrum_minimum.AAC.6